MTKAATKTRLATHVPVAPMRERFLEFQKREGLSASDVAWKVGWTMNPSPASRHKNRRPDSSRVARVLGLKADTNAVGVPLEDKHVIYENAVKLCRALDMDPVDCGV